MKKRWLAFLLFLVLCFAAVPVLAEGDSVAFCLDGEIISTAQAGEITLPEAPALERGRVFIGWRLIQNGEEVILPAGATCTVAGDALVDALTVRAHTNGAASVYAVGESIGLRFTSQMDKADYTKLLSLFGEDGFTFGTLIATKDYTAKIGGRLTAELLSQKGYDYIEIETDKIYKKTASYEEWAGSVSGLKAENMSRTYTAIGYLTLRYANGQEARVYLDAAVIDKSGNTVYRQFASAETYTVLLNAYDDRNAGYKNVVWENGLVTYSPYTEGQLAAIKRCLDSALSIRVSAQGTLYVEEKGYYKSPYQINYDANQNKDNVFISAKDGGALSGRLVAVMRAGSFVSFSGIEKSNDLSWRIPSPLHSPDF